MGKRKGVCLTTPGKKGKSQQASLETALTRLINWPVILVHLTQILTQHQHWLKVCFLDNQYTLYLTGMIQAIQHAIVEATVYSCDASSMSHDRGNEIAKLIKQATRADLCRYFVAQAVPLAPSQPNIVIPSESTPAPTPGLIDKADRASHVIWEYKDDKCWSAYTATDAMRLEQNRAYGMRSCDLFINESLYRIDFSRMIQTRDDTRTQRQMRRRLIHSQLKPSCFRLLRSRNERPDDLTALDVENAFFSTCAGKYKIVGVYSVVNDPLVCAYNGLKASFEKRLGKDGIREKWLWHGTSYKNLYKIQVQGFNRDYNLTAKYGRGVYFARDASYSMDAQYAAPEKKTGFQYLLYCKVLVGASCEGKESFKRPRERPDSPHETFDSFVDQSVDPTIYVTCRDAQCIPCFLVEAIECK